MDQEERTILSQRPNLSIELCSCCDNILFIYKNILLKFRPKGFIRFCSSFQQLDFKKRAFTLGNGVQKMVVNTSLKEIKLCFDKSEFDDLCGALKEATVMLEVNDILYAES